MLKASSVAAATMVIAVLMGEAPAQSQLSSIGEMSLSGASNAMQRAHWQIPATRYLLPIYHGCCLACTGVTQQGLTEQLLNVTVKHERPDLEEARETLIKVCADSSGAS